MTLKYKHRILFVDDEPGIINSLTRIFRKEGYNIGTATSGQEGLNLIEKAEGPFSVIVSDQRMPGMTGSQFLEKSKKILPDAIRILLTGYSDMDSIVDAINKGGIHRYITKPWNDEDVLHQVRQSLEQYELIVENRRLLALTKEQNKELKEFNKHLENKVQERTGEIIKKTEELSMLNEELETNLYNTARVFGSLAEMEVLNPSLAGHGRRVSVLSREIAQLFDLSEREVTHIEIAALLHDVGKIELPQKLLTHSKQELDPQERALFRKHPERGQETVQFIKKLDHVGILIRSHHEWYDGHGYPDHLMEEEIPLGAKIIAVADAYDKIVELRIDIDGSIEEIKKKRGSLKVEDLKRAAVQHLKQRSLIQYDPDVVKAFLDFLETKKVIHKREINLPLDDLKEGMILSRTLYSSKGRFILPYNTTLTEDYIERLKKVNENDPIENMIYVSMRSQ